MNKSEIIKLKLFETRKLVEFYLNELFDDTKNSNPCEIARAFSIKLKEMVKKHDRLIEHEEFKEQTRLAAEKDRYRTQIKSTKKTSLYKNSPYHKRSTMPPMATFESSSCDDISDDEDDYVKQVFSYKSSKQQQQQEQHQRLLSPRKIEKSLSNLSKDSGIFSESYHSEYSNSSCFNISENYPNHDEESLLNCSSSSSNSTSCNSTNENNYYDGVSVSELVNRLIINHNDNNDTMNNTIIASNAISTSSPYDSLTNSYHSDTTNNTTNDESLQTPLNYFDNNNIVESINIMQVSMIDSIQATNNSMSSSLLTFT